MQADVPSPVPILTIFSIWRGYSFAGRLQKWQETTETTSLLLHPRRMWERGRVVRRQQLSFFFFPPSLLLEKYSRVRPASGEQRKQLYLPHLWCVVLSNEDARPGYRWPRYGGRICVEEKEKERKRTWALWKKKALLSATEDTLSGPLKKKKACQRVFSAPLPFKT